MTVRELNEKLARHTRWEDEVRIELKQPEGGYRAYPILKVDTDPLSGVFFIELEMDAP